MSSKQPVLAFVSEKLRGRICRLLPQTALCASWTELRERIERNYASVVIVEPTVDVNTVSEVRLLKERCASVSFIVYTELDPKAFRRVVEMIQAGVNEVVLFGYDDERGRLERLIEDIRLRETVPVFNDALAALLIRLPRRLRQAVEDMLRDPRGYHATADLASAAEMSTRAVFRHLKQAGFSSPRRLVAGARVLRAHQLLSATGRSVHEVASLLRYPSADQLSQHFSELAGCTANDVKKGMPREEFVESVVAAVVASETFAAAEGA